MRADRLVDSLLLLAQSERLTGPAVRERVELPEVAAQALSAVAAEVQERRLEVATSYGPAGVLGDRGLLERLAGNLVENAVRHNLPDGWVRVDTGTVEGRRRLRCRTPGGAGPGPGGRAVRAVPAVRHGPHRATRRRPRPGHRAGGGRAARRHRGRRRPARRRADRHRRPAAQPLTGTAHRRGGRGKMLQDPSD
jgi:hypothetical protein